MATSFNRLPIGVFDSGVGGISVLAELIRNLPDEGFIYFADSANAPYGTKDCECVRECSLNAAMTLRDKGVKALVVACNTATSAAINHIRGQMNIPVIGMEPAVKPAVEKGGRGYVVVMATPLTLREKKFNSLIKKYNGNTTVLPIPCPGLVDLIEAEAADEKISFYLRGLLKDVPFSEVSALVLGCTHYCFVKPQVKEIAGPAIQIIDGNAGTVRHLINTLKEADLLLADGQQESSREVEFITTGDSSRIIPLCRRFLAKALDGPVKVEQM